MTSLSISYSAALDGLMQKNWIVETTPIFARVLRVELDR